MTQNSPVQGPIYGHIQGMVWMVVAGFLFVSDLFEQHLAHKTILSILAWLVFGLLLLGRHLWGWRGRTAVRMTIAGVIILLLSYFGSKLVLEVLLGRSWGS